MLKALNLQTTHEMAHMMGFIFVSSCKYTIQNLLRITFSFNDLMLKTNRLKKDFFIKIG